MRSSCSIIVALVASAALTFGSSAIAAQGRGKGPSTPKPASHPAPPPKAPASAGIQGPKGPKNGPPVTAPAKGQAPKGQSPKGQGPKTTPPGQSERVPSGTVVTTATVQEQLASKPQLRTKLIGLLPPGTDINLAAAGFRNFGQFVAAVHVSRNLGIPFDQLKARMTGPEPMSLGQAITQLKPGLNDIETEVRRAENEANEDLKIRKR